MKLTELDYAVMDAIKAGSRSLSAITGHVQLRSGTPDLEKRIDRSLQKLRKAGWISYHGYRHGWKVVEL